MEAKAEYTYSNFSYPSNLFTASFVDRPEIREAQMQTTQDFQYLSIRTVSFCHRNQGCHQFLEVDNKFKR
jgi:hypothetical protein